MTTHALITVADLSEVIERLNGIEREIRELKHPPKEWILLSEWAAERGIGMDHARRLAREGRIETRGSGKCREVKV